MMQLNFGGGDNEYMDAANRAAKSGGPSLIAGILDMLGIHTQVAKPPKEKEGPSEEAQANQSKESQKVTKDTVAPAPVQAADAPLPLVANPAALPMFIDMTQSPAGVPVSYHGQQFLNSLGSIFAVDPDKAAK